jgi:glycosyltransferase involved in cell wall biosynthesis
MKILHTESSCGWGGQEIRILEEAKGMIERGHEVTLACPEEARIFEEAPRFGVPVHPLPIRRKPPRGIMAMRRYLMHHPVDVINTHSSTDSWLVALACATMANPPAIVRTRHISAAVKIGTSSRWLYGSSVLAHLITTGESLRQTLVSSLGLNPQRVTSVPTGIDPLRFSPAPDKALAKKHLGLSTEINYIGIVATLRSWKGHLFLIDAFARLQPQGWKLIIVGDGPMQMAIEEMIVRCNLGNTVILAGHRRDSEAWLRAFDIFCLPSYANEGVPQALVQAMLTGLPIVTTPVGAITEAVSNEETALIVEPKNIDAIAGALERLVCDPLLGKRLGEAARQRAEAHFSRTAMLDRMEHIFQESVTRVR